MPATRQPSRARTGKALLAAITVAAVGAVVPALPASAAEPLTVQRFAGADRYATAGALAQEAYPDGAGVVIVASGESFPDALAATALAGTSRAPVLLTRASAAPEATLAALRRLRPGRLVVVGGTSRIGSTVIAQMTSAAGTTSVEVIAGPDRYGTASDVARSLTPAGVGQVGGKPTAFLATGQRFPDALAAGSVAAAKGIPLLLTPPGALPRQVDETLTGLGITQVVILGGPSSVSADVETALEARGLSTVRLGGADRQDTAAKVADWAVGNAGMSPARVALARGDDAGGGADALALGPLAGLRLAPVLLAQSPQEAGAATRAWAGRRGATLTNLDVAGGPSAVSDGAVAQVRRAAAGLPETPTPGPSTPPGGGPAGKNRTCAEVPQCRVVDEVDFDGDGVLEEIGYAAIADSPREDGSRGEAAVIFVVPSSTGVAQESQYYEDPFSTYAEYLGASDIDGVPGVELVVERRNPPGSFFQSTADVVPSWKNGGYDLSPSPQDATNPFWDLASAYGTTGITCESPGEITVRSAVGQAGEDVYQGTVTRYRWDRAGSSWKSLGSTSASDLRSQDLGPEWSGWTCPGIPRR